MTKKLVCFVFMGNLYLCPYINKYLENMDCDFDIIYWNRDGIDENIKARNVYSFDYKLELEDGKWRKIKGYWHFMKCAGKVLGKNRYDGVILLQTIAGILLRRVLKKHYLGKFILDIRDYTLEKNCLFFLLEKDVINASTITVISSEGYRKFLPPFERYVVVHNNRTINDSVVVNIRNRQKERSKLIIAFIGRILYQEQSKKLMNLFKNDTRFELWFIGADAEKLTSFCERNNISNVKISGRFLPENIMEYYKDVDIINNLYGNNDPRLDFALSNKLYFAAQLCMPILVCKGTYMEEISVGYGFGYTFDIDDEKACDKLWEYYHNIDWDNFREKCDTFLKKVEKDNHIFNMNLKKFIEGEKND